MKWLQGLRWLQKRFDRFAPSLSRRLPWLGGLLLVLASGFGARSWSFAHTRVKTAATVTENIPQFAKEGGILYSPRLRFRTADGDLVQVTVSPGTEEIEFPAGETVPVSYRAGDPQSAVIATAWRAYHAAIVLGLWGTAIFDLGWVLRLLLKPRPLP